jgi:carbon-monoxide dehydrogenase medium subunit
MIRERRHDDRRLATDGSPSRDASPAGAEPGVNRLRPFTLHQPTSVEEAVHLLAAAGGTARPLAGGTDLLIDMKLGRARPPEVVNLKRIDGLDRIEPFAGGTRIGALVRVSAIASSELVRERWPALWQASSHLASQPVRNLATIGGNLGRGSPAGDMTPPLIVHGAVVEVAGPASTRSLPIEDLHVGPGVTCLAADEIITAVVLPDPGPRTGSAYRKLGKRGGGWDIALAGVAAGVVLGTGGEVVDARVALASVAPTTLRVRDAESALRGAVPTDERLAAAAAAAAAEARPISDIRATATYRRSLVRVLALRTLLDAVALARQGAPRP